MADVKDAIEKHRKEKVHALTNYINKCKERKSTEKAANKKEWLSSEIVKHERIVKSLLGI